MKDFDREREKKIEAMGDRSFKIGGETFIRRPGIRPEVMAQYEGIDTNTTADEVIKIMDDLLLTCIEPEDDAHARWHAIRAVDAGTAVVSLDDMTDLVRWLMGEFTGRPTQPPSRSSGSPENDGTSSTGDSSSKATRKVSKD